MLFTCRTVAGYQPRYLRSFPSAHNASTASPTEGTQPSLSAASDSPRASATLCPPSPDDSDAFATTAIGVTIVPAAVTDAGTSSEEPGEVGGEEAPEWC